MASKKDEMPKLTPGVIWKTSERKFCNFLRTHNNVWVWKKGNKPAKMVGSAKSVVKSRTKFVSKVSGTPLSDKMGLKAGFTVGGVTPKMIAEFSSIQKRQKQSASKAEDKSYAIGKRT